MADGFDFDFSTPDAMGPMPAGDSSYQLPESFDPYQVANLDMGPKPEGDVSYEAPASWAQFEVPSVPMTSRARDSQAAYGNGSAYATAADWGKGGQGALSTVDKLMRGLGIQSQDGKTDLANPKTLDSVMKLILGGANAINALAGGNQAKGYLTPAQMQQQFAGPYNTFNPQQQAAAGRYFGSPVGERQKLYSADMQTPITRKYAEGGAVAGALSLVHGPGGGQDDLVDARLSPGEWIGDADFVSALGDGNNEEGARRLDQLREMVRAHKRSADPSEIPPMAKHPADYMRGALSQGGGHGRA